MWGEQDSNLRRHKSTELQSVPVGRFGIPPCSIKLRTIPIEFGAQFAPVFLKEVQNYMLLILIQIFANLFSAIFIFFTPHPFTAV